MILKHRDTEVLRFDWVKPFGVKDVELNKSAERFLPLAFRDRVLGKDERTLAYEFEEWLLHRTAPMRRECIEDMLRHFGFLVDNDLNEISGVAPIFDNGYSLFSRAISNPGKKGDEFHDLRLFLAHKKPKLYKEWLGFPTGVTDEMIDRIRGMGNFEFRPHPEFVMPDKRLEVSQYFLQNRIAKIIKYREKADRYLKIRASSVRINPLISDKMLKKAKKAEDLRKELKTTLKSFPRAKTDRLAVLFKTTTRTIARHIKSLQEAGELKRMGSRKTGWWQVIEKETEQ